MAEKTLIIHPGTIEFEIAQNGLLTQDEISKGEVALRIIKQAIDTAESLVITDQVSANRNGRLKFSKLNGDVYLLIQDELVVVQDCVSRGDNVRIMGAYANVCCAIVEDLIGGIVDNVYIDQEGAWTISNVRQRAIGLK